MVKLVYWGGAMSGKTTSVKHLFDLYDSADLLQSIETSTGRTLFFDFGELIFNRGKWEFRVNVWTATGQDYYRETRHTVLTGVDGIVFVADSNPDLLKDNIRSWLELSNFLGMQIKTLPIIICLNKRDLDNKLSIKEVQNSLKIPQNFKIIETIATNGLNVLESFQILIKQIFNKD